MMPVRYYYNIRYILHITSSVIIRTTRKLINNNKTRLCVKTPHTSIQNFDTSIYKTDGDIASISKKVFSFDIDHELYRMMRPRP